MGDEKDMSTRVALIEERLQKHVDREWVKDFVLPTQQAVVKIEAAVSSIAGEQKELAEGLKQLYATHDAFLKQQAADQLQQAKERTLGRQLFKWSAIAGAVLALAAVFRLAGTWAELYVKSVAQHEQPVISRPEK